MLHILLLILKIIGIILAILAGLFILVMLIPFSYVIKGDFNENVKASLVAKWLQGIIYFRFSYLDENMTYVLRILGIPFLRGTVGEDEEEASEEKETEELIQRFEQDKGIKHTTKEDNDTVQGTGIIEDSPEEYQGKSRKKFSVKIITSKLRNIKKRFKDVKKKIRNIKKILKSEQAKVAYYYAKDIIHKLYNHIKPSKFAANLIFGFDSPDKTGKALAALGVLYGTIKIDTEKINIIPDFENKRLEGDVYAKGHFVMGYVLINVLKLYFKKEIHEIIERFNR